MVINRRGTLRWAMDARVAMIMHPRDTPDHRNDSGKKREMKVSPAPTREKEMKRTRGASGS
jgi:hypothetical protein